MTWTADETRTVKRALLGSWPGTIAGWGKDAIDAYTFVLQARGLPAEDVVRAIVTWPAGSDFPPSAPNLAAAAMRDVSAPTFSEMLVLARRALRAGNRPLTGDYAHEGEMILARERLVLEAAEQMHPLAGRFIARFGVGRLRDDLGDVDASNEHAGIRLRDLEAAWREFCETWDGRDVAALAAGERRGSLGRLDPLAVVGTPRWELETTTKEDA